MSKDDTMKPYAIRFSDSEVAAVRDITKVDAVAPAVRSIVLKAIEAAIRENGGHPVPLHDRRERKIEVVQ